MTWNLLDSGSAWDAALLFSLLVVAAVYGVAVTRIWSNAGVGRGIRWWEVLSFATGWLVLATALSPFLHNLSQISFAAHMTQHELLMLVAAPLVVIGRPLVAVLWLLPIRGIRAMRQRPLLATWRWLTAPFVVLVVHGVVLWVWHVPVLFEAALRSEAVHAVQHVMFFWTAALFWWALVHGRYGRLGYGVGVLFVFITAMHTSLLGALLTFAPRPWYAAYEHSASVHGTSALDDQQLAGLLMWVPSGALFLVCGLALMAAWLGEASRRAPATVHQLSQLEHPASSSDDAAVPPVTMT